MNESISSTYSTGENRVTTSILAVLRCLALPRIERILGALMENADFQLVQFVNQDAKGRKSVPDARISSSCRLLLETKIVRNDVKRLQLEEHLKQLKASSETVQRVLVLTPDDVCPAVITEIGDPRLIWNSFAALNQAIDELFDGERNEKEVISEREAFLLRELQKMLLDEKLIGSSREVLVIPARAAWPLYNEVPAYICKAGRAFQSVKYIAFYSDNQIYPLVPKILGEPHDHVVFESGKNTGRLGQIVDQALGMGKRAYWPWGWGVLKVFLLTVPDAKETLNLGNPILNDIKSKNGQRIAFTQNQRYVSLKSLREAKTTSDLEAE